MDASNKKNTALIVLGFSIMAVFGFLMNLRGALIPSIRSSFNVSYSGIGFMIVTGNLGFMTASFFSGMAVGKLGLKKVLLFGFTVTILSTLSIAYINSFTIFALTMFFTSIGMGCFEICLNSLGARIFITNAAIMMNFLHLFYGVGSTLSPGFTAWLLSSGTTWRGVYLYSLLTAAVVLIFLVFIRFPAEKEEHHSEKTPLNVLLKDKRIWVFSGLLGFCIVAEAGVATWFVNFLQTIYSMDVNVSSSYMSLFFIMYTIGRLVGGFIAERMGYTKMLLYFSLATLILFGMGLTLGGGWIVLFSMTGFFISALYPTVMTILMKEFKKNTTVVIGITVTAACTVNMIFNWLIGKTNDFLGVWAGFASLMVYIIMIIVFLFLLTKVLGKESYKKELVLQD